MAEQKRILVGVINNSKLGYKTKDTYLTFEKTCTKKIMQSKSTIFVYI